MKRISLYNALEMSRRVFKVIHSIAQLLLIVLTHTWFYFTYIALLSFTMYQWFFFMKIFYWIKTCKLNTFYKTCSSVATTLEKNISSLHSSERFEMAGEVMKWEIAPFFAPPFFYLSQLLRCNYLGESI